MTQVPEVISTCITSVEVKVCAIIPDMDILENLHNIK
jgi:hypothetical protein